jgi:hypothetical protein
MDLLERARALAACPLFENLAPAVVVRLAERARSVELARGERRTSEGTVWVVASGGLAIGGQAVRVGTAIGVIRVVRAATPVVEVVAEQPSVVVGLAADDVRDILEEDPVALAALAERLAALLKS